MKKTFIAAALSLLTVATLPAAAQAGDWRGHDRGRGHGYGHDRHHAHPIVYRPYYRPVAYRPVVYRPVYAAPQPVYYAPPVLHIGFNIR